MSYRRGSPAYWPPVNSDVRPRDATPASDHRNPSCRTCLGGGDALLLRVGGEVGAEGIAQCAGEARDKSTHELNRVYNELRADLVNPRPLVRAQRSWLAYRTAQCEYQSSGYDCESGVSGMCSVERAVCQVHLTCERVRKLREHMQEKCNGCPVRKGAARPNRSFDADVRSASFAGLLPAGQLRR